MFLPNRTCPPEPAGARHAGGLAAAKYPLRRTLAVLAIGGSVLSMAPAPASASEAFHAVASAMWQAHFEGWIETTLIEEQLDRASERLPELEAGAALDVLDLLVKRRLDAIPEGLLLPEEVIAKVHAPGISGPVRQAGLHYARGHVEKSLEILESDELEADADAAHLLAQIRDFTSLGRKPVVSVDRLESIADYRYALSLAESSPQEDRARVRIGQIFAELRLIPEARAALGPALRRSLSPTYRLSAVVSFVEAAYLGGDSRAAIERAQELDLDSVSAKIRRWAIRRTADSLYELERYRQAIQAYARLIEEYGEPGEVPAIVRLRLAMALLEAGKPADAQLELRPLLTAQSTPQELTALAGLLLARSLRETEFHPDAARVSAEIVRSLGESEIGALAAVEAAESERLALGEESELPSEVLEWAERSGDAPEFGLLAYRAAAFPDGESTAGEIHRALGRLLRTLPPGPVYDLVLDDLTTRLQTHLRDVYLEEEELDPDVLKDVAEYLRPAYIDQNALILALETFYVRGDWERCIQWGRTLHRREVGPVRRGLGAWRALQCRQAKTPKLISAKGLLRQADTGRSGPFALALAVLAAETTLRRGKPDKAVMIYNAALESIADPRVLGPVLLRAGELNVHAGNIKLGVRRLLRGLSLTEKNRTLHDPFRKAGIIALGLAVEESSGSQAEYLRTRLEIERKRAEQWWSPAYAYLAFRTGGRAPKGEDVFSRAALEARKISELEKRVEQAVGREALEAARSERRER